jgi:hypothetical protein
MAGTATDMGIKTALVPFPAVGFHGDLLLDKRKRSIKPWDQLHVLAGIRLQDLWNRA